MIKQVEQFLAKIRIEQNEVEAYGNHYGAIKYAGAVEALEALLKELKSAPKEEPGFLGGIIEEAVNEAVAEVGEILKPKRRKRSGRPHSLPKQTPAK